jgi:GntR family transcriptional regulator / MocR family aminotransferase
MTRSPRGLVPVLAIDRGGSRPLYRQIYEAYRDAILGGRLGAGERLPSTRGLARELGVSRFPVLTAFDQLLAEGYCESRAGAGTFVAADLAGELLGASRQAARRPAVPTGPRRVSGGPAARLRRAPFARRGSAAFSVGAVATEAFPFRVWGRLLSRQARRLAPGQVHYGETLGVPRFQRAIAAYLRTARGVRCEDDQVMVVSGSQQALDLAARALLDPDSAVWLEDPGYWGARDTAELAGARCVPVPVDAEGLDVAAGMARCPDARVAFVTPSHQFPLGVTMSAARRLLLLDWASHHGAWIVEDDYNGEYRYESQPITALQALDREARVIYVGTLSKVLSPSLRVGYVVLPEDLVDRFAALRAALDIAPPTYLQEALADFFTEGHFAGHLRRMRRLYSRRRGALIDALRGELGADVEILGEGAGLHLVLTLPEGADDLEISDLAAGAGLHVLALSSCSLGATRRRGLVLGYGGVPVDSAPEAVRRLAAILDRAHAAPRSSKGSTQARP